MKVNGFVAKLESVVLSGNLDAEILDGVKVAVEVSALKMSSDMAQADDPVAALDLLTVALKLQGDVGHWVDVGSNAKVTLEGKVQIALGGKLAARLASYTAAQIDRIMAAKEIEVVGETVAKHVESIGQLESRLAALKMNPGAARREIRALEEELFRHRIQVSTGGQQLKGLSKRLGDAKGRARAALGRLEGKFAKKVAWAMEKKVVAKIATGLSKLLPVLNVLSTIADVIEIISLVRDLIKHHGHSEGEGDESSDHDAAADGAGASSAKHRDDTAGAPGGAGDVAQPPTGGEANGDETATRHGDNASIARPPSKMDPKQLEAARNLLSPTARTVIAAVQTKGGQGPELDPDQLRMVGLLVPADLRPEQVQEVVSTLRGASTARTPEDVIVAIDQAVRNVRNMNRTVTVDGVARPDLMPTPSSDGSSAVDGPVTSPEQVEPPVSADDPAEIVRAAPPAVIGRWFRAQDRELVLTDEGAQWKARHVNALVGGQLLQDVGFVVANRGEGQWTLRLTFKLTARGRQSDQKSIEHTFFVDRGDLGGLGAQVGDLHFAPYAVMGTVSR